MKRVFATTLIMLIAPLMILFPLGTDIPTAQAQSPLIRVAAEFKYWGEPGSPSEASTSLPPLANGQGGTEIYHKTVVVPPACTVYLTISTTGDTHLGAGLLLSALVDGQPFNPGNSGAATSATGWFVAQKHFNYDNVTCGGLPCGDGGGGSGDIHDNSIYYTWCKKVAGGVHTFAINMASTNGNSVFLEKAHFYIDSTLSCLCVPAH